MWRKRASKVIRFLLASLLWLHALFLFNLPSNIVARLGELIHLTSAELLLFVLLLAFSFLAGAGFKKVIKNFVYIYFFPFILVWYGIYLSVWFLIRVPRLFTSSKQDKPTEKEQAAAGVALPAQRNSAAFSWKRCLRVVTRPIQRFTFLWCLLLVVTMHREILWLSVIIVVLHLARSIFKSARLVLSFNAWFVECERKMRLTVEEAMVRLASVTPESEPNEDLKKLWGVLASLERLYRYEGVILQRTWLICLALVGCLHIYFAFLYSFIYYGVARLSDAPLAWIDSFVTALFIPFLLTDLPKTTTLRILGCTQLLFITGLVFGAIVRYLRRQLESVRTMATAVGLRLADETLRTKYLILAEKFEPKVLEGKPAGPTPL